jgi:hypothetical protein
MGVGTPAPSGKELIKNDELSAIFPSILVTTSDFATNTILRSFTCLPSGTQPTDVEVVVDVEGAQLKVILTWNENFLDIKQIASLIPELQSNMNHTLNIAFGEAVRVLKKDSDANKVKSVFRIALPIRVEQQLHSELGHNGYALYQMSDGMLVLLASMIGVRSSYVSTPKPKNFILQGAVLPVGAPAPPPPGLPIGIPGAAPFDVAAFVAQQADQMRQQVAHQADQMQQQQVQNAQILHMMNQIRSDQEAQQTTMDAQAAAILQNQQEVRDLADGSMEEDDDDDG